jgi:phosphatidate cytidylyltransferase
MSTLVTRALSGALFVAIVVSSFIGGPWLVAALFGVFTFLGTLELFKLSKSGEYKLVGLLFSVGFYASMVVNAINGTELFWPIYVLGALLIFVIAVFSGRPEPVASVAGTLLPTLYLSLPFASVLFVATMFGTYDYLFPLLIITLIWINDTGAYLCGTTFGKHKMVPKISPGKTWEGTVGGLLLTVIAAFIYSRYFDQVSPTQWLAMGAIASVFATLGDLFESRMKRAAGVKDSGKLMPGHGGVLDRFDAMLFVFPAIWAFLQLCV